MSDRSTSSTNAAPQPPARSAAAPATGPGSGPRTLRQRAVESVFPLVAVALVIAFFVKAQDDGFGTTYAFPLVMIALTSLFALITLVRIWWPRSARTSGAEAGPDTGLGEEEAPDAQDVDADIAAEKAARRLGARQGVLVLVSFLVLVVLVPWIGILVASGLFMLVVMPVLGYRKPLPCLAIAAGTVVVIWLVFEQFLAVPLPTGPWGF
jgi:hypothetical protein